MTPARMKCDHHRAPIYFSESIRSPKGFWGWSCTSMEDYDMGRCPAAGPGVLAGDRVDRRYVAGAPCGTEVAADESG